MNYESEPRVLILRQIAAHLAQGRAFREAFELLARHPNAEVSGLAQDIAASFDQSGSIVATMRQHPTVFPEDLVYIAEHVAEQSPDLGSLFTGYESNTREIRSTFRLLRTSVRLGAAYLTFVLLLAFAVLGLATVFVFPAFEELYASNSSELPALTRFVMSVGQSMLLYWPLAIVIPVLGYIFLSKRISPILREGRFSLVKPYMRWLPIIGARLRLFALARAASMIQLLASHKLGVSNAYALTSTYLSESGADGDALTRRLNAFGGMEAMVYYEKVDSLDDELTLYLESVQEWVAARLLRQTRLMGIVSLSVVALIVAGIVGALYLPLFNVGGVIA